MIVLTVALYCILLYFYIYPIDFIGTLTPSVFINCSFLIANAVFINCSFLIANAAAVFVGNLYAVIYIRIKLRSNKFVSTPVALGQDEYHLLLLTIVDDIYSSLLTFLIAVIFNFNKSYQLFGCGSKKFEGKMSETCRNMRFVAMSNSAVGAHFSSIYVMLVYILVYDYTVYSLIFVFYMTMRIVRFIRTTRRLM